jgi:hypothetical protein
VFGIPKSSNVDHVADLAAVGDIKLGADEIAAIEAAFPLGSWKGLSTI